MCPISYCYMYLYITYMYVKFLCWFYQTNFKHAFIFQLCTLYIYMKVPYSLYRHLCIRNKFILYNTKLVLCFRYVARPRETKMAYLNEHFGPMADQLCSFYHTSTCTSTSFRSHTCWEITSRNAIGDTLLFATLKYFSLSLITIPLL